MYVRHSPAGSGVSSLVLAPVAVAVAAAHGLRTLSKFLGSHAPSRRSHCDSLSSI
jgi:hypothetical protein